jgi:hypothetical protein
MEGIHLEYLCEGGTTLGDVYWIYSKKDFRLFCFEIIFLLYLNWIISRGFFDLYDSFKGFGL